MVKLFVSDCVIEKYGKRWVSELEYDDFKYNAVYGRTVETAEKLLLSRDDMDNIYLSVFEDEESFSNVEDLKG